MSHSVPTMEYETDAVAAQSIVAWFCHCKAGQMWYQLSLLYGFCAISFLVQSNVYVVFFVYK